MSFAVSGSRFQSKDNCFEPGSGGPEAAATLFTKTAC